MRWFPKIIYLYDAVTKYIYSKLNVKFQPNRTLNVDTITVKKNHIKIGFTQLMKLCICKQDISTVTSLCTLLKIYLETLKN